MFEISEAPGPQDIHEGAKIRVIGIGGGGCNAVNTMIKEGLSGVEYIVANTDAQALNANLAPTKIQLGHEITKGLGAGANPEIGRKAALDEYEKLSEVIEGADMVFITAGMGGGTGTGAAPVIAKLAKELGALTVGVVTKPFLFEGKKRFRVAEQGIGTLEESVDSLITIPNQRLLYLAGENLSLVDTFRKADEVLLNAVRGISDLINNTGHINADFADVSTVMSNKGLSLMGTGVSSGADRAIKAATEAISSPLLEDISIDGATGIIINITGNETLTMHETNEAVTLIMEAADDEAEIIFGTVIDDSMEDNIKVTVVATGLGGKEKTRETANSVSSYTQSLRERPVVQEEKVAEVKSQPVEVKAPEAKMETAGKTFEGPTYVEATEKREEVRDESVARTEQVETPVSEAVERSTLADSIKKAAGEFEDRKQQMDEKRNYGLVQDRKEEEPVTDTRPSRNRARSIAEKLGFLSFDEEELDSPSYLRKEETQEKSEPRMKNERDLDRPMDL